MDSINAAQREKDEFALLLARVGELPEARQLEFHRVLSEVLGGKLGEETERSKQVRQRREALDVMRAAAEHLGLPQGQAPSVDQFKQAARDASLPMSFKRVHSLFDGRWHLACRYYQGLPVPRIAREQARREYGEMI